MASTREFLSAVLAVSLFLSAFISVKSQLTGVEKVSNLLLALEHAGDFNSFIYALKATKVDADLITLLDKTGTGVTVLAPRDKAFPNVVEARNAAQNHIHLGSLRHLISSHIVTKHLTYEDLISADSGQEYATFANPVHTAMEGVTAAEPGQETLVPEGRPSLIQMPGAVATITDKIMDDGEISCFGIGILLIPPS